MENYAISAYRKIEELEKEYLKLKKALCANLAPLGFKKAFIKEALSQTQQLEIVAERATRVRLEIKPSTNMPKNVSGGCKVFVNNLLCDNFSLFEGERELVSEFFVEKGKVTVMLELYSLQAFSGLLTTKIYGAVDYLESKGQIEAINGADFSGLMSLSEGKLSFTYYDHEGLGSQYTEENVKQAAISGLIDGRSVVAVVDEKGNFFVRKIYLYDMQVEQEAFVDEGITSLSGAMTESGAKFYAVKNGSVYQYNFDSDLKQTKLLTPYQGVAVCTSPQIEGAIIIIGYDKKATLIDIGLQKF